MSYRCVLRDLYDIYDDLLCECPFPQVTDKVDGGNWHYIPDYVTQEACLRLHVALVKVWGTPSMPMKPNTPCLCRAFTEFGESNNPFI